MDVESLTDEGTDRVDSDNEVPPVEMKCDVELELNGSCGATEWTAEGGRIQWKCEYHEQTVW